MVKSNWPTKKLGISINKAKALALKEKQAMDKFYKKYWLDYAGNEQLTIILKTHLYIENLIDEILSYLLPNSRKILNYKFSSKVDILEALNVTPSKLIIEKIRQINKIRNDFSHNLNKRISKSDLEILIKDIKIRKKHSNFKKFRNVLMWTVGYLHAFRTILRLFPFTTLYITNKEIFQKDKALQKSKIKDVYLWEKMKEFIKNMELR